MILFVDMRAAFDSVNRGAGENDEKNGDERGIDREV